MDAQLSTKAENASIKITAKEYMTLWDAYTYLVWDKWLRSQGIGGTPAWHEYDEIAVGNRRLTIDMEGQLANPVGVPTVYEVVKCPGCGLRTLVEFSGFGSRPNEPTNCVFCTDPELREGV